MGSCGLEQEGGPLRTAVQLKAQGGFLSNNLAERKEGYLKQGLCG